MSENSARVIKTGEMFKDTKGLLSFAWYVVTLGKQVIEYEREKVKVFYSPTEHLLEPLPQMMEGDYAVYYELRGMKRVNNSLSSPKS